MAKDRDTTDPVMTSQSKRPPLSRLNSDLQVGDITLQQCQGQLRSKGSKHMVGSGTGTRLYGRVASSKALHKHHASASATRLARKQESQSPDQVVGPHLNPKHRRSASEVKLPRDHSVTNLKIISHTSLKPNKSNVDVAKKSKSATNLKRSSSNLAVDKIKTHHQVHWNLGDDGQDHGQEDEWVDASTSASPLLSRQGSTISGDQSANPPASANNSRPHSPSRLPLDQKKHANAERNTISHNKYLTSRLLKRSPSCGATPKMSTDTVVVQGEHSPAFSGSPSFRDHAGSSNGGEVTSRFLGNAGATSGSGGLTAGEFLLSAVQPGDLSRTTVYNKTDDMASRQARSLGDLEPANTSPNAHRTQNKEYHATNNRQVDSKESSGGYLRNGTFAFPRDTNRTQKKLNLQRASSNLEATHPHSHPTMRMGMVGVGIAASPLIGGSGYDSSRDPRLAKLLERTGAQYLVVRRYQNPVARSLFRLMQLPGIDRNRRIPTQTGTLLGHSQPVKKISPHETGQKQSVILERNFRDRDPNVVTLITRSGLRVKRPSTPLALTRGTSMSKPLSGAGSGMDTDEDFIRVNESHGLSGTSLVDGEEDAGTVALLRNLWDKNIELSASQD